MRRRAGPLAECSLEEIFEAHLAVTRAGCERVTQSIADTALALRLELQAGLAQVEQRFARVDRRFGRIERRLDHLLLTMGGARLDHEARIAALDADVAKLKAG